MYGHKACARWLLRSSGWRPIHFACDRRASWEDMTGLLQDGADPMMHSTFGEAPLRICTLANPAEGARPESEETTAVIRQALLPWLPARHQLFPRSFTRVVLAVLLLHQRLERRAGQLLTQPMTRQRRQEAGLLAVRLTRELLLLRVVPYLPRFQGAHT